MWIELKERQSQEVSGYDSADFRRIQKVKDGICITFKDGGEILFDEDYDKLMKQLSR